MNNCNNCNHELNGNYCSNCGLPVKQKRIDSRYIKNELKDILYVERGIFFTIKELAIRPGQSVRKFISEDRNRLVKPFTFLIITSLIYSLINFYFRIDDKYVSYENIENSAISVILKWVLAHSGYANIIMGAFVAFWTKVFFKKYGYNFFEILILLCFLMGIEVLICSILGVIEGVTNLKLAHIASLLGAAYTVWATTQFFENKLVNYFKAIAVAVLGWIVFILSIVLSGTAIDIITNNI